MRKKTKKGISIALSLLALIVFVTGTVKGLEVLPEEGLFSSKNIAPGDRDSEILEIENTEGKDISFLEVGTRVDLTTPAKKDLAEVLNLRLIWKGTEETENATFWTGDGYSPLTMKELEEGFAFSGLEAGNSEGLNITVLFDRGAGNDYQGSSINVSFLVNKLIGLYRDRSFSVSNKIRVDALDETKSVLELKTKGPHFNEPLEIKEYPEHLEGIEGVPLNKSLKVEVSREVEEDLSWMYVKFYYEGSEVPPEVKESSLEMYSYNEGSDSWSKLENTGVNSSNNYVWGKVNRLTRLGIVGEKKETGKGGGALATRERRKRLLSITPSGMTIEQGKSEVKEIVVKNPGEVDFSEVNIDYSFEEQGEISIKPDSFSLEIGDRKKSSFRVEVPEEAESGTYPITLRISAEDLELNPLVQLTVAKKPEEVIKEEEVRREEKPPEEGEVPTDLSIQLNHGADKTNSTSVVLTLHAINASECRYNNDGIEWSGWEDYTEEKSWTLSPGEGEKRVYYQCRNEFGRSDVVYDSIILEKPSQVEETRGPTGFFARNQGSILAGILTLIVLAGVFFYWKSRK